jgi:DNA-binding transcriptional MerR regulator
MKVKKTYYSISEVSNILGIKEHTIRFWDSKLPGLSKASEKGKTRFFTQYQINKLANINYYLNHNSSLELANKLLSKETNENTQFDSKENKIEKNDSLPKFNKINYQHIIKNLKNLLK